MRRLWVLALIATVVTPTTQSVQATSMKSDHPGFAEGVRQGYNMNFAASEKAFDKIIKNNPEDPRGYFYVSGIYFWRLLLDPTDEYVADFMKRYATLAIEKAEKILDKNEKDQDARFILGAAYGSLGRYHLLTKSYLSAVINGNRGYALHKQLTKDNPEYWDAYLGVGMFEYYAEMLPKIVTVFLDTDGDRENGLRAIKLAAERGTVLKPEAKFFYGQTQYLFEEDYELGVQQLEAFLRLYPEHILALNLLASTHQRIGKEQEALKEFNKSIVLAGKKDFPYMQLQTLYLTGNVHEQLNDFAAAEKVFTSVKQKLDGKKRYADDWLYRWAYFKLCRNKWLGNPQDVTEANRCLDKAEAAGFNQRLRVSQLRDEKYPVYLAEMIRAENLIKSVKYDEALTALRALEKKVTEGADGYPKDRLIRIHLAFGRSYYRQGELDKSFAYVKKVFKSDHDLDDRLEGWPEFLAGHYYLAKGKLKKARESFDDATDTDDKRLEVRANKQLAMLKAREQALADKK